MRLWDVNGIFRENMQMTAAGKPPAAQLAKTPSNSARGPKPSRAQTVDKLQSTVNFLKNPKKPKGKGIPHVEYNYINTTRKKIRR